MEEYLLGPIKSEHVRFFWDEIHRIMNQHPVRNGAPIFATQEQILIKLMRGEYVAWIAGRGREIELLWICSVMRYPAAKALQVVYLGGSGLHGVFANLPKFEGWARSLGCTHIETNLSPGMARMLRRYGFATPAAYAFKSLELAN